MLWLAVGFWAVSELVEAVASRLMTSGHDEAVVTVVVPGFRNSDPRHPNFLNRWRAKVALRTARHYGSRTRILVCGGDPVGTGTPEADLLFAELRRIGFLGPIDVERESRSTFENSRCIAPLLKDAERVAIASNPLHGGLFTAASIWAPTKGFAVSGTPMNKPHGLKLRIYLMRESERFRRRFVPSTDFRLWEWGILRVGTAAVGICDLFRVYSSVKFVRGRLSDGESP